MKNDTTYAQGGMKNDTTSWMVPLIRVTVKQKIFAWKVQQVQGTWKSRPTKQKSQL